jgi:hypothetical protein
MKGNRNHESGVRARRAPGGFADQPLQDSDRNGIELREAGPRVLEPLHPSRDLARVGDCRQAGVEMRDRRRVEIRLESLATPGAQRRAKARLAAATAGRREQVGESTNEGVQQEFPGPGVSKLAA